MAWDLRQIIPNGQPDTPASATANWRGEGGPFHIANGLGFTQDEALADLLKSISMEPEEAHRELGATLRDVKARLDSKRR